MKKTYLVGPDKLELISSHQQGIRTACLALPVYIQWAHQNTSGSAVSELMRFIHHIMYMLLHMYIVNVWCSVVQLHVFTRRGA